MIRFKNIVVDISGLEFKAKGTNIMYVMPMQVLTKFKDHIDQVIDERNKREVITMAKAKAKKPAVKKPSGKK